MQAGDEIHAGICANAVGERGLFCQRYDTTALVAAGGGGDATVTLRPG
jgi:hypothetical protein